MFVYDKIPDKKITDIVNVSSSRIIKNMPKTLLEFCKAVEKDNFFYYHHTTMHIGSKTLKSFRKQIYDYLESVDAIEYSIEDPLHNACIQIPLTVTFNQSYPINEGQYLKIKDIPEIFDLKSGQIKLQPYHKIKFNQLKKIPENIAEVLRDYIKYVLKCKDKNFEELKLELATLETVGILTESLFKEISNKSDNFIAKEKQS